MYQMVATQRQFFNTHTTKSLAFRLKQLKKLDAVLKANEQALYDAIYKDFKKSFSANPNMKSQFGRS